MNKLEKKEVLLAEFGAGSSLAIALTKALEEEGINYKYEVRSESDEGYSFDISVFSVSNQQFEQAKTLKDNVCQRNEKQKTYKKFHWIGVWILTFSLVLIMILFILSYKGLII